MKLFIVKNSDNHFWDFNRDMFMAKPDSDCFTFNQEWAESVAEQFFGKVVTFKEEECQKED